MTDNNPRIFLVTVFLISFLLIGQGLGYNSQGQQLHGEPHKTSGTGMPGENIDDLLDIIYILLAVILVFAIIIIYIVFVRQRRTGKMSGISDSNGGKPEDIIPEVKVLAGTFPKELLDRYEPQKLIGRGGISQVFRCSRKSDGSTVAVKIPILSDEKTGRAFLEEMKILEGISHPNIVRVFSANILPVPYVEMEYYPDSLDKLKFPVDIRIAVYIMTQILEGLEFAHHKGIIHCDIKPGNILINDDFIPAVSDWGLGIIEGNRKNAGYSPGYAAPEQIKPEIYGIPDRRCDIYQAGLLFYEMVTGIMPFAAEGPEKSENMIINLIPKPPSEYSAGISEYDSIIMKCLSKDPDRRFETVAELKAALKNVNPQKSDRTIIR
jgi:serine/threonine protein kinase/uncharacterized membrane protein